MHRSTAFRRLAGLASLLLAASLVGPAGRAAQAAPGAVPPGNQVLADRLAAAVTGDAVYRHLAAFQLIADRSGGNRAWDQVGFTRSADYVSGLLTAAGYRVVKQTVPYTNFEISTEQLTVSGAAVIDPPVLMTRFAPSTPVSGIDAPVVSPAAGRTGCDAADYAGLPVAGSVVVLARAACGYSLQQQVAAGLGARAVLLYYATPSPENSYRFFAFNPADFTIPVASVSQRDGEELVRASRAGTVRVHLTLVGRSVPRTTVNVLAETAGGDPNNVVLLGAHLDSVPEGPGINDNGSTAATVLQVALALANQQHSVRNKVRFAWWGAEEMIDVGSGYYVSALSAAERQRIAAVLNGELIAAPNDARFVWDPGTGGSHVIAGLFGAYFDRRGLPYQRTGPESVGSDHLVFQDVGIPVGGIDGGNLGVKTPAQQALFGGEAGQMFDHCYHQTCDTLATVNRQALGANAPALAWVLGRLASDVRDVRAASTTAS
ncbi:M28 family peptidase [Micromonospora eburnea]|uniref:N-acetylated-alpha-linked acidic dipeptidase n=1 Tax=Micromonospora eburnea TaxID=227316 RepID=A0A1C6TRN0_9ACTN|nr:M28 family peptidase [Micromonospora eburnea]SCL44455.1 N-acetylated-alpha-linked acidic dipeptidase [Micromonospora eburnea]